MYLTKIKAKVITLALVFLSLAFVQNGVIGVSKLNLPTPVEKVTTQEKAIALTINVDWGEEFIPKIIDILRDNHAQVTFFVTGRWAEKNSELLKQMAAEGHAIENHGYFHSHPDKLPIVKTKDELLKTEKIIQELTGRKSKFYAPPYGERGRNGLIAADELGYTTVLWTFDTIDWRPESTPQLIAQRVLEPKKKNGMEPDKKGAIVLMHPKANTIIALPNILKGLQAEGYNTVTLEKLITLSVSGNTTS